MAVPCPAMQTRPRPAEAPRLDDEVTPGDAGRRQRAAHVATALAVVGVVVVAVVLRFWTRSPLWLDEALSVNIARLPFDEMVDALRRDGHPPLYYLLLHVWTEVFGTGNLAVRSLSGIFAVATLAVAWPAGRRYGGRAAAVALVVLLASSPFAVRYATEARMYSLVAFLVLSGWLAVRNVLERPTWPWRAALAACTGFLLLSHYWAFYVLAVVGGMLLWLAWRRTGDERRRAGQALLTMAAGSLLFLPWLPSFLEQAGSTGTPWGRPDRPANLVMVTLTDWGGGPYGEAQLLGIGLLFLVALALTARVIDGRRLEIDLHTRPEARGEAVMLLGTLVVATLAGYATSGAFASRYTSIVLPVFLLMAALGASKLSSPTVRAIALAGLVTVGLVFSARNVWTPRTQAADLADAIDSTATADDVVAYCPDQLGPAVSRELTVDVDQVTYPDLAGPRFVNWVDYEERMTAADPVAFADELLARAGDRSVFVVWAPAYRTLGVACEAIIDRLAESRPGGGPLVESGRQFEHAWLYRFPAP